MSDEELKAIIEPWMDRQGVPFEVDPGEVLDLARRVAKREREQWRSLVESLSDVASAAMNLADGIPSNASMKCQQWALTVRKRWHEAVKHAAAIRGTNERKDSL